ncbi:MAG: PEP-CTERM sorting domain-containing protein [bacterium]|nr:PEP-CTERM sorting domain-containing protein [bacterium]
MRSNSLLRILAHLLAMPSVLLVIPAASHATVFETFGSGSAVSQIDATVDFEDPAALVDVPYIENGISVTRVNGKSNNGPCGYAGCDIDGAFVRFVGNFMYAPSDDITLPNYIEISTTSPLLAIEFALDSSAGSDLSDVGVYYAWDALLSGTSVGSGATTYGHAPILGFLDPAGFDTLRIRVSGDPLTVIEDVYGLGGGMQAIDSIRAQYLPVPEPGTGLLTASGLISLAARRRHSN